MRCFGRGNDRSMWLPNFIAPSTFRAQKKIEKNKSSSGSSSDHIKNTKCSIIYWPIHLKCTKWMVSSKSIYLFIRSSRFIHFEPYGGEGEKEKKYDNNNTDVPRLQEDGKKTSCARGKNKFFISSHFQSTFICCDYLFFASLFIFLASSFCMCLCVRFLYLSAHRFWMRTSLMRK